MKNAALLAALLTLLGLPARAQNLPDAINNSPSIQENFEYLDQQVKRAIDAVNNISTGTEAANSTTSSTTFTGSITISTGGSIIIGTPGSSLINTYDGVFWAQSVDGATQSSGCLVAADFPDGGGVNDYFRFSSTTTVGLSIVRKLACVLVEASCAPLSFCRIQCRGIARVQIDSNGINSSQFYGFSTTRCRGQADNSYYDNSAVGKPLQAGAVAANAFFWTNLSPNN